MALTLRSPRAEGPRVSHMQELLHHNRFRNFHPGKVDGVYDMLTANAVRRAKFELGFRHVNKDAGIKLRDILAGGPLGPVRKARRVRRLAAAKAARLLAIRRNPGAKALGFAIREIGNVERPAGSNLTKYGLAYGMNGVPWCAIFQSWCFHQVESRWRKVFRVPLFHYSFVPFVVADAEAHRNHLRRIPFSMVRPGDLACYDWEGDGVADHIGIIEAKVDDGNFDAIEGNTAVGNDSNGGQVMRRRRNVGQVRAFVRVGGGGK